MLPFLSEHFGNPQSQHIHGLAVREAIDESCSRVAALFGANKNEIIFTASGTESNNLALKGVLPLLPSSGKNRLLITEDDHPSITQTAHYFQKLGYRVDVLATDSLGVVDLDQFHELLTDQTAIVSVPFANPALGTIQPIADLALACRKRNILFHTDATYGIGKSRIHVQELEVDMLSFSGSKMYAPPGTGGLYVRAGLSLTPLIHGGTHASCLRGGTENVAGILGLGAAAKLIYYNLNDFVEKMETHRDRLCELLCNQISDLVVRTQWTESLPNTLCLQFPQMSPSNILASIPELSAAVVEIPSIKEPLFLGEKLPKEEALSLSVGWFTTKEEIDQVAQLIIHAWEQITAHRRG